MQLDDFEKTIARWRERPGKTTLALVGFAVFAMAGAGLLAIAGKIGVDLVDRTADSPPERLLESSSATESTFFPRLLKQISSAEIRILSPGPGESVTIRGREALVVRGELAKVEFEALRDSKAYVQVTVHDPKSSKPLQQRAFISNSLDWRTVFDRLGPGKRVIDVTASVHDREGIRVSSVSSIIFLTRGER
jgi:hypothetical protein